MSGFSYMCADFVLPAVDDTGSVMLSPAQAEEAGLSPPLGLTWAELDPHMPVLHFSREEDLGELVIRPLPNCPPEVFSQMGYCCEVTLRWTLQRGARLLEYLQAVIPPGECLILGSIWLGDCQAPVLENAALSEITLDVLQQILDPAEPEYVWNRGWIISADPKVSSHDPARIKPGT